MGEESSRSRPAVGEVEAVLDTHEEFVVVLDEEGRLLRWDERFETLTEADLPGTRLSALADDPEAVTDAVRRTLSDGAATATVTVAADGSGHELRFARTDDRGTATAPTGGETGAVVVLGRAAAPPVAERHVLDRMTDAFFAVDAEWRLTYVNDRAQPILAGAMGVDPETDLVGRHLWESVPDAVGTQFHTQYTAAMRRQEPVRFEAVYDPLSTRFEVQAYPSETGLSVHFRDVTDRHERREALAERSHTLRRMYEITSDADREFETQVGALLELGQEVLDADYGVLSRIDGEEYVHEVARSPGGVIEPGTRVPLSATACERTASEQRRVVLADVATDDPGLVERIEASDFEWDWAVSCYVGAPVFAGERLYGTLCFYDGEPRDGDFSEWETTVVDIMSQWVSYELTKRRTTERLRAQNEQLEQFVSVVSHDLRNPLETLSGHLDLAAETGDAEHFEWCRWAVDRMDTLIEDLLALARAGETVGETETVELADLARECWAVVDHEDARLVVETDRTVAADRSRLRQAIENLFGNAVEHGGDGVTVTVGDTSTGFFVADDGPGIPSEERTEVFETGYTTAEDGTGFGLNIVRQIAEAHGWRVELTDGPDGGARFEFTV
jgi:two-component sensor histidine kinase/PAS domain-containing protein